MGLCLKEDCEEASRFSCFTCLCNKHCSHAEQHIELNDLENPDNLITKGEYKELNTTMENFNHIQNFKSEISKIFHDAKVKIADILNKQEI
jgi:hypothetical protein